MSILHEIAACIVFALVGIAGVGFLEALVWVGCRLGDMPSRWPLVILIICVLSVLLVSGLAVEGRI